MGAFTVPLGLTGNLFDLWGIARDVRDDEPLDPPVEAMPEPHGEDDEETAEQRAEVPGAVH